MFKLEEYEWFEINTFKNNEEYFTKNGIKKEFSLKDFKWSSLKFIIKRDEFIENTSKVVLGWIQ